LQKNKESFRTPQRGNKPAWHAGSHACTNLFEFPSHKGMREEEEDKEKL